jgi:hypothetical protein
VEAARCQQLEGRLLDVPFGSILFLEHENTRAFVREDRGMSVDRLTFVVYRETDQVRRFE